MSDPFFAAGAACCLSSLVSIAAFVVYSEERKSATFPVATLLVTLFPAVIGFALTCVGVYRTHAQDASRGQEASNAKAPE